MRHLVKKVVLGRKAGPRRALLKNLAEQVLIYEQIKTTLAKAKAVRPVVEKIITIAKKNNLTARRRLLAILPTKRGVKKTLEVLGPRFKNRQGGYSRILKLGRRAGDAAPLAIIQLLKD